MTRYVVLLAGFNFNGQDGYADLGVWEASSRKAAANKALKALAADPYDSEGGVIAGPDPSVVVIPLRTAMPLEGLTVPAEIAKVWELEGLLT